MAVDSDTTTHPVAAAVEVATGGLLGAVGGLVMFPFVATFSPFCASAASAEVCGALGGGVVDVLAFLAIAPSEVALLVLLAAVAGAFSWFR